MNFWFAAVLCLLLAWALVIFLSCPKQAWKVGVSARKRFLLTAGSAFVSGAAVSSGIAMWIVHGAFHPAFLILTLIGIMFFDAIVMTWRLPVRSSGSGTEGH